MTHKHSMIEDRLKREAGVIFSDQRTDAAASRILTEHARRDRRRLAQRKTVGGLAVAVVLGSFLSTSVWNQPKGTRQAHTSSAPSFANGADPASPQEVPVLLRNLSQAVLTNVESESAVAIPLLVTVGEWNGRPVVAAVVYVPPHARPVNHASLTKAERAAVERLLRETMAANDRRNEVAL